MRTSWLLTLLLLVGCNDGEINIGDDGGDANDNATGDNGVDVPSRDPDETISGDLADGEQIADLSFAEQLYCWVATENENFSGNHVFYERTQSEGINWFVRATPDPGVDISVYVIQRSVGSTATPPDISCTTCACYAMHDQTAPNPGQGEVVESLGLGTDLDLLIGVAGAEGATSGGYTLEIWGDGE